MKNSKKYTIKTKEIIIEPKDSENIWEGEWTITVIPGKHEEPCVIGTASFAGEKLHGTVPLKVEIMKEYRNQHYGTRVFKLMVDFAFGFKNIYEVSAVTSVDNDGCRHALERAGFVHRNTEHHMETLSVTKPKSSWLGLYLYIGIICGLILGVVFANVWVGLIIGIILGLAVGAKLDSDATHERRAVTGEK